LVQFHLDHALALAPGERFVIRSTMPGSADGHATTIGGGRIIGTSNRRQRPRCPEVIQGLQQHYASLDDPEAWFELHLLDAAGPISVDEVRRSAHVPPVEAMSLARKLVSAGKAIELAPLRLVHKKAIDDLANRILDALAKFHDANPNRLGMTEDDLAKSLNVDPQVRQLAFKMLSENKAIVAAGSVVALPGRHSSLSPQDAALCARLEERTRQAGLSAPTIDELAVAFGEKPARVRALLRVLADQGAVAMLDSEVVMHREGVELGKQAALRLFAAHGSFTTPEFRDAAGVSRKHIIPLLDYLDKIRFTVRSESRRTPGSLARAPKS
jgi:selenocysteine-specific elongation factor